jgi:hypothetical protein
MRTKILALLLVALVPLLAVTTVNAKPTVSTGTIALVSAKTISSVTHGHTTVNMTDLTLAFTGGLTGTTSGTFRLVVNTRTGTEHFQGTAKFTGTVDGKTGSVWMRIEGTIKHSTIQGHFVLLNGSSGLEDLHGHASFQGSVTSPTVGYTLTWHFSQD